MSNREQEIFSEALERDTAAERAAFLDSACAGRPETRTRIEALIRAEAAATGGNFLTEAPEAGSESPGTRIGSYRLLERLGEGGFGVVYHAEQEQPVRRSVALKIIKLGMDTRAVVARFEAERQALALMEHPNIARVFDGGATETGRPYFVMELVPGVPITTYCTGQRLRLTERLELFLQVCRAVHHAHQKGVIHRDLKPSNILITSEGERPTVKVIDFGIAKATHEPLTEKTLLTRLHVFLGTPAYMSPEQIGPGASDVDTRSDIYSLGALLYELLADSPAFDTQSLMASGYAGIQHTIHHVEPPSPSQRVAALREDARRNVAMHRRGAPGRLVGELRGDLDRIVLKCLEKERARRYETTEDLAQDITRYLHHEPVLARPATLGYRATKFVRRHRRGVFTAAAALLLLGALGIYHAERLATERDRAQLEAHKANQVSELLTELLTASDPFRTQTGAEPTAQSMIVTRVRKEFAGQPMVRAEILNAIGRVYLRRGEHDKALPVLTEALDAGREIGQPDLRLAQTLNDLGVLERERGDYPAALKMLNETLTLRRQLLGNEHNDVAVTLVELSRVHRALERLDLAESLSREALAIRQKVLGDNHRETATSLGDLAVVLWQKGDLPAAESLFKQSLAMHRNTVGSDHPNVGQSLANLAQLKVDQQDFAAAEALLREALAIARRSVGAAHWRTALILGSLGDVCRRQGRLDEASLALDEALPIARAALGPDRPLVAELSIDRARVHLERGEAGTAERLLREALQVQRHFYAVDGWHIASTESLLGAALMNMGRTTEAEPLLVAANRILKDIPGPQGRETQSTRARLAALTPR
jgi:serine/threonine protein kinase/Flp pilus assembly protein TadD